METIQVREADNIDCKFSGDEQEPLGLLISGAGAPAAYWPDFFCTGLAEKGFRVLRYRHRDTVYSTHFDVPYDILELYHDLIGLIGSAVNMEVIEWERVF